VAVLCTVAVRDEMEKKKKKTYLNVLWSQEGKGGDGDYEVRR